MSPGPQGLLCSELPELLDLSLALAWPPSPTDQQSSPPAGKLGNVCSADVPLGMHAQVLCALFVRCLLGSPTLFSPAQSYAPAIDLAAQAALTAMSSNTLL